MHLQRKFYPLVRGVFNKFPDFLVQVIKIVENSRKFSMLWLYILWDDWPTFMISGSNEQLQQQLKYTLLKPDCHSWWFSKMQSGRDDTLEERHAIKLCFKLRKNATETYGMLQTAFRPSCKNQASVFEWHKRFKEGRESMRDDERCGISTRTMHQSTTPSLSQTIWPRWASTQFLSLPIVQTLLPVTFGYSLSSEAVVMRQLRRWKRLWQGHWHAHTRGLPWGLPEVVGTVLHPEGITSKRTRVSCVHYQ